MGWFFKSKGKKDRDFWDWFHDNEEALFNIKTGKEPILAKLSQQLMKIKDGLSFEIGPPVGGKREFFISAGGLKDLFPAVEALHARAYDLERWIFIKFKQRKQINELHFADKIFNGNNVFYTLNDEDEKIGIDLFFEDYNEKHMSLYGNAGFILLDNALGEFDVATKVGEIRFRNIQDEIINKMKPIRCIATDFDSLFEKKSEKK